FNERGLVVSHEKLTKSVPLSTTFAVTIPTGGPPRELTASAPQHHWGMSLLNPLPQTLNAASDIDVGMHGLEQRGTPRAVGQRTSYHLSTPTGQFFYPICTTDSRRIRLAS